MIPNPVEPIAGGQQCNIHWRRFFESIAQACTTDEVQKAIDQLQRDVTEIKEAQGSAEVRAGAGIVVDGSPGFAFVSLEPLEDAGGGELVKIARDSYGRVAGTSSAEAPQDGKQYARKDGGWQEVQQAGGGGVLPMVNGETPPVLMYGGNQLIYARVE